MQARTIVALALALACGQAASAKVTGQIANGFAAGDSVTLAAAPQAVWAALIEPRRWWNPEHSWSGSAANFTLDPRGGGCFCEALPDGGSVEHMRVVYAAPGKLLRMKGALGPMQGEGLNGALTVTLEPAGTGTRLTWTYKVGGYTDLPFEQLAPASDGMVSEQMHRLANVAEGRKPEAP
jgi:uncharacterized protein YndB with AHSA1/START domain